MSRRDFYIGWIPNVAGRLSFSHIGASDFPARCERENTGNSLGRRIVATQRRRLSDWLLPNWYFQFLYGFSADWRFVLVGGTAADPADQIARLEGEIFAIEAQDWDKLVHDEILGETFSLRERFQKELTAWARLERPSPHADLIPEQPTELLRAYSLFTFRFGLRRSGILWLTLNSLASDLTFAEDYEAEEHRPSESDVRYLANQAFFFLKDISHTHRHHPPGSDTITEVGRIDRRGTWAIDTHYRIHRKVVEMRRSRDPKVLYQASGMLAYLSAMGKAVTRSGFHGRRSPIAYNNAEIESSIKASLEVMKWRQTQKNIIKTALPALGLSALALSGYDDGTFGGTIRDVLNSFFRDHPKQAIASLAMLLLYVPFYYGILDFYSLPPILRAKRILVSLSIKSHAAFWLIGGVCLFGVAFAELALASIIAMDWAAPLRAHVRPLSWAVALGSVAVSALFVFLLPFWATRKDLWRALSESIQARIVR